MPDHTRMTSPPRRGNGLWFRWIYQLAFLVAVVVQMASAGLCTGKWSVRASLERRNVIAGDNEIFMKAITDCLEKEKLDLKKINLPCFTQKQVDVLVKCRGEAYIKAVGKKASAGATKRTADFKVGMLTWPPRSWLPR
ncbi:hypothetical protein HPB50_010459 [Hyalomma asiaticum]|uniref:Uncharacterized protein n=1 Tax=Hyalomma asiaticum TaxID=266040 RepID=A0ACB7RQQ9_HYAAI|nr:hypothetical protein HPB50_010459 [Hyalomma asiaticum]